MKRFQNWLKQRPLEFKVTPFDPPYIGVTGTDYAYGVYKRRTFGVLSGQWTFVGYAKTDDAVQAVMKREIAKTKP